MKISSLSPNEKNPRTITDQKLAMFKKALAEFGDLSGIVYNRKSKQLVGGHQRCKLIDKETPIVIQTKHSKPTKVGTVAEGYIEVKGERYAYREVYWPEHKEKAANIAANKGAGEWDMGRLNEWLKELSAFDLNFDLGLTMFDAEELAAMPEGVEVSAHTRNKKGEEKEETEIGLAKCKAGEVYALGESRLKCGADDLHYCDLIISRWEKYSGQEAVLQIKTQTRKPEMHAKTQANG